VFSDGTVALSIVEIYIIIQLGIHDVEKFDNLGRRGNDYHTEVDLLP
jgi:hypothetical protein